MNIGAKITLLLRNFIKKYGRTVAIVFGVWVVLFSINQYLKNKDGGTNTLSYTYNPNKPVMTQTSTLLNEDIEEVNKVINKYFVYCNNKDYESAWDVLTDDCKEYLYENNIENFKSYVDSTFNEKKTYNIQNYSNVGDTAVYVLNITPEIEKTGTSTGYTTTSERIAFVKVDGRYKLSINNYIKKEQYKSEYQDDYVKVKVEYKDISYTRESYHVTIENITDKYLLIADDSLKNEVTLNLGDEERSAINLNINNVALTPGEKVDTIFTFTKYFDDGDDPTEIKLNAIRVYEKGNTNALKVVSSNIKLEK